MAKRRAKRATGATKKSGTLAPYLRSLGPGIVTGAADDDPSGIATYSQVGARFGYGILWTALFSLPLMIAVQQITAEIGRVTGRGVTCHMKKMMPPSLSLLLVLSVGIANVINIGADVAAMGAATRMLIGGPSLLYAVIFVAICLGLQVFVPYDRYAGILKWSTLALFTYFATPFVVDVEWWQALRATLLPSAVLDPQRLTALTAVLGTTISPYLLFWQASQEAEELDVRNAKPLRRAPAGAARELRKIRTDTFAGMFASNLIAYFIMLTCAATLHANHVTNVESPEQVAEALRPIAGSFAFLLFTLGIVGTGMLAIPVLAGATAYALADLFDWRASLEARWYEAKPFYGALAAVTLAGLAVAAAPINPMRALYASAVLNGIAAVPALVATMRVATSKRVMGEQFVVKGLRRTVGWATAGIMFAAALGSIVDALGGWG